MSLPESLSILIRFGIICEMQQGGNRQMARTLKDITRYVEGQCNSKCKVLSAKIEATYNDFDSAVNVWNVKTNNEGDWWVVEGEQSPMNLYPQGAYYFTTDEAYSFHLGIIQRMTVAYEKYEPEKYIEALTLGNEIAPTLFRKLTKIASLIDSAVEIEDFQSIGVQCREIMIELGNNIYSPYMSINEDQPKESNFKKKADLFIQYMLPGSHNSDYREWIRKITDATWNYANKITHSQTASFYDVSTCVSLTISLVSMYENERQKSLDLLSNYQCPVCKSKKISIIDSTSTEEGSFSQMVLRCEECGHISQINTEKT